jgi:glycosyltransferase involved in cell wall biosynthesis
MAKSLLMVEVGGRGGVTDYTASLASALADAGWDVTLASATDATYDERPGVRIVRMFHYFRAGSSRTVDALRALRLGPVLNGLAVLAALPRLALLARRAAVVHSQGEEWPPLGVAMMLALRIARRPLIYTAHNTFDRGSDFPRARRAIYRLSTRVIVHTEADVGALPASVRGRAAVIPHGEYGGLAARAGAMPSRADARAALGLPAHAPVVLLFGRLRSDKGIGDLLSALGSVDGVHAVIAGADDGGLDALRGEIAALRDRVLLREGHQSLADTAQLFAAADAAVLAYPHASASGVLLLAYGFARPVVAYPVGGLPEAVVDGETGWLCARADPAALADALAAVAAAGAGECDRRGAAGREFADRHYAWSSIAQRTGELYEAAMRRASAATE